MPLIHGADGAKLSKRHGAQGVEEYRDMGYLPVALRNYLVRLGWSHGDDEIISTDDLIRWFDIDGINKSPARLDFKKLDDLNGHYIRAAEDGELEAHVRGMLPHLDFQALAELPSDPKAPARPDIALAREVLRQLPAVSTGTRTRSALRREGMGKIRRAIPSLKERSKTLTELVGGALFIVAERPLKLDDKAAKLLSPEGRASNSERSQALSGVSEQRMVCNPRSKRSKILRRGEGSEARQRRAAASRGAHGACGFSARYSMCWKCWAETRASRALATPPVSPESRCLNDPLPHRKKSAKSFNSRLLL